MAKRNGATEACIFDAIKMSRPGRRVSNALQPFAGKQPFGSVFLARAASAVHAKRPHGKGDGMSKDNSIFDPIDELSF